MLETRPQLFQSSESSTILVEGDEPVRETQPFYDVHVSRFRRTYAGDRCSSGGLFGAALCGILLDVER